MACKSRKGVPRARTPDGPLTTEQQELVVEWYRYAIKVFRNNMPWEFDPREFDVESVIALELCRLARRFDPGLGLQFKTLLVRRMIGLSFDLFRHASNPFGCRSRINIKGRGDRSGIPAVSQLVLEPESGEEPVGWEIEYLDFVESLLGMLSHQEREAIRLRYTDASCALMRDAGEEMGVTENRYSLIHDKAVKRLREVLACRGHV